MKAIILLAAAAVVLAGCQNSAQKQAETLLKQADEAFEKGQYDRAIIKIDSLRELYPSAIDVRTRALKLYQNVELKRAQIHLEAVDSMLQAAKREYDSMKPDVELAKQELRATQEQMQAYNMTKAKIDSLQVLFDTECAKIKYIRKKQKEL